MAVYVPDPDGIPADELIELLGWELAERFTDAENVMLAEVARRARRIIALEAQEQAADAITALRVSQELSLERARAYRALQDLARDVVNDLRDRDLADWLIDIAAKEGEAAAAARLQLARRIPGRTFPGTSVQAVGALTLDLSSRLEALEQRILRFPQDVYQQVISQTAPRVLLGTENYVLNQREAVKRFLDLGVTGFVDKGGRRWTIGAYAEMAGRTATARAWNDAGVWRMQQSGINLVTVQGGFDACRKCAPWIGKILSTDGTTGTVTLPHATQDGTVTVTIEGTVDQARAAGWAHPNCRDRLSAYLPGLSVPQADFEYNEAAEKERARHRELERDVRAAKRREATAMDDTSRARARRDIADAQAELREFTRETGRKRQSYREQLHFADGIASGRGVVGADRVSARRMTNLPANERRAQFVPSGAFPRDHELATGDRLARVGINARWRPEDFTPGVKNPDVMIGGHVWDFKSPEGAGKTTISNQFARAKEQGVHRLVLDMARSPLDGATALAEARRRLAGNDWFTDVIFIDRAGNVTWLTKE